MHEGEFAVTGDLVTRLVAARFPRWAGLPVTPVASSGTVNALFRIGTDLVVRLPRVDWSLGDIETEATWLPLLAPRLPVAIPEQLGIGLPAEGYPWPWAVYRWLPGTVPVEGTLTDPLGLAADLAGFVRAMRAVDPGASGRHRDGAGQEPGDPGTSGRHRDGAGRAPGDAGTSGRHRDGAGQAPGGPGTSGRHRDGAGQEPGDPWLDPPAAYRGGGHSALDPPAREALAGLAGLLDPAELAAIGAALDADLVAVPDYAGPPVWLHADLMPGNLLVDPRGRLAAVIDFATLGVGDPSCDLIVAWNLLTPEAREVFRAALDADDQTWRRGRGRALAMAVIALVYYHQTNPAFADNARYVIREVLEACDPTKTG
ncbi:aminoglycoside phosphotransferase family protein [Asanoa sp. NPDC049573]|uniref:aminoglycoside phosphotransferase family protein n=1 Tax=Asanoa sp. NPDC049573 TaxID=3155396 RepID=UPI0034425FA9